LDWDARQVLSAYASRWALAVTLEGAKQVLGLEAPANRLPQAVRRTAPVALVLYSLVVLWFDTAGHEWGRFSQRPWYRRQREPSFPDMLTTLRRQSWAEKLAEVVAPHGPHGKWLATVAEWVARVGCPDHRPPPKPRKPPSARPHRCNPARRRAARHPWEMCETRTKVRTGQQKL
jgi:hypothetical protein